MFWQGLVLKICIIIKIIKAGRYVTAGLAHAKFEK